MSLYTKKSVFPESATTICFLKGDLQRKKKKKSSTSKEGRGTGKATNRTSNKKEKMNTGSCSVGEKNVKDFGNSMPKRSLKEKKKKGGRKTTSNCEGEEELNSQILIYSTYASRRDALLEGKKKATALHRKVRHTTGIFLISRKRAHVEEKSTSLGRGEKENQSTDRSTNWPNIKYGHSLALKEQPYEGKITRWKGKRNSSSKRCIAQT